MKFSRGKGLDPGFGFPFPRRQAHQIENDHAGYDRLIRKMAIEAGMLRGNLKLAVDGFRQCRDL